MGSEAFIALMRCLLVESGVGEARGEEFTCDDCAEVSAGALKPQTMRMAIKIFVELMRWQEVPSKRLYPRNMRCDTKMENRVSLDR